MAATMSSRRRTSAKAPLILETVYDDGSEIADGLGRPQLVTENLANPGVASGPTSYVTRYEYDDAQNAVAVTDPRGNVTEQVRDGLGRLSQPDN